MADPICSDGENGRVWQSGFKPTGAILADWLSFIQSTGVKDYGQKR
jgi:hypothetical protein